MPPGTGCWGSASLLRGKIVIEFGLEMKFHRKSERGDERKRIQQVQERRKGRVEMQWDLSPLFIHETNGERKKLCNSWREDVRDILWFLTHSFCFLSFVLSWPIRQKWWFAPSHSSCHFLFVFTYLRQRNRGKGWQDYWLDFFWTFDHWHMARVISEQLSVQSARIKSDIFIFRQLLKQLSLKCFETSLLTLKLTVVRCLC